MVHVRSWQARIARRARAVEQKVVAPTRYPISLQSLVPMSHATDVLLEYFATPVEPLPILAEVPGDTLQPAYVSMVLSRTGGEVGTSTDSSIVSPTVSSMDLSPTGAEVDAVTDSPTALAFSTPHLPLKERKHVDMRTQTDLHSHVDTSTQTDSVCTYPPLSEASISLTDAVDLHCEVGCQTESVFGMEGGASGTVLGKVTEEAREELEALSRAEFSSTPNVQADSDVTLNEVSNPGSDASVHVASPESRQRTRGRDRDKVKGTSTCSQATIADVKACIDAVASINELNAIQYLKNGMDLFDKLVTERGFPTKRAQTDYARKLYEMLQNVQATLEDLLGFFEVHWYLTGQMNRAETAKFLEVSKCSDYRIVFFGRPRSFDK
ncbi:unnamed protein product [Prorocentrum cordatum]|uniref:Uncharacterized protein n=1 Tax=Prorocentrum cordatum TaxID=2364126 RepID=A0ABN9UU90_9DINO|nr:unnamed protein product [Polarella glacialis]